MPRELITIQIGQCGNQIGCRFWDHALKEHAFNSSGGVFDDSMGSFFRNVDVRYIKFSNREGIISQIDRVKKSHLGMERISFHHYEHGLY
jgi:hypothetical protein